MTSLLLNPIFTSLLFFMYFSIVVSIGDHFLFLETFSFPAFQYLTLDPALWAILTHSTLLASLWGLKDSISDPLVFCIYPVTFFFLAFNTTYVLTTPKITCLCLRHAWYTRFIYASNYVIYQFRYYICQLGYLVADTLNRTFQKRTLDFTIYHNCSSLTFSNLNKCILRDYCTKLRVIEIV